jgi:hypothetical protein
MKLSYRFIKSLKRTSGEYDSGTFLFNASFISSTKVMKTWSFPNHITSMNRLVSEDALRMSIYLTYQSNINTFWFIPYTITISCNNILIFGNDSTIPAAYTISHNQPLRFSAPYVLCFHTQASGISKISLGGVSAVSIV